MTKYSRCGTTYSGPSPCTFILSSMLFPPSNQKLEILRSLSQGRTAVLLTGVAYHSVTLILMWNLYLLPNPSSSRQLLCPTFAAKSTYTASHLLSRQPIRREPCHISTQLTVASHTAHSCNSSHQVQTGWEGKQQLPA